MARRLLAFLVFTSIAASARADHLIFDSSLAIDGPSFALPGQQITYLLRMNSLFPRASYAVTDTLPANVHLVSASAPNGNCIESNGKVICGVVADGVAMTITLVIDVPSRLTTLVNSATITSLSTVDTVPDNDTATLQTVIYDATACAPRRIDALAPSDRAVLSSGSVTLRWSPVPAAVRYDVWVSEGSTVARLLDSTNETQLTHDFEGDFQGDVAWFVEAAMTDCPAVATPPQRFTIAKGAPAPRRRAVSR
jgi:hypothetical protein